MVMRGLCTGGDASFVQGCAQIAEICAVHRAARPVIRTGGGERSARARMAGPFHVGTDFGSSMSPADSVTSWNESFCDGHDRQAKQRRRDVRQMVLLRFQKVVRGRPADGTA